MNESKLKIILEIYWNSNEEKRPSLKTKIVPNYLLFKR